jgi:hypothetical protein
MGRDWKSRPAPRPTTITEIARRYHAAALALGQTLGLSLAEVLAQHRESVTAVFIEASRADLRLPAGVRLPPLSTTTVGPSHGRRGGEPVVEDTTAVVSPNGQPAGVTADGSAPSATPAVAPALGATAPEPNGHTIPTTIPSDGDLPCRGMEIASLKPAQLAMLLARVANLVHAEGDGWVRLLGALQAERAKRIAQGARRPLIAERQP